MKEQPVTEGVELFMRVGEDGEELLVGIAKDMASVPDLLSAIAEHWSLTAGRLLIEQRGDPHKLLITEQSDPRCYPTDAP